MNGPLKKPMLGSARDTEADGVASADASADDLAGAVDDENGIQFAGPLPIGEDGTAIVSVEGGSGRIENHCHAIAGR